jgi:Zn-dependent protease with chaperone function
VNGFAARYFDGKSSKAVDVTVTYSRFFLYVCNEKGGTRTQYALKDCRIEPPLGSTSRTIRFANGALCETTDFAAVEVLERSTRQNTGMRMVSVLEGRWRLVAASLVGIVLCTWIFMEWGIPAVAGNVSRSIPPAVLSTISNQTMETLDKAFLSPSQLDGDDAVRMQAIFQELHRKAGNGYDYRLVLRGGRHIGANAFALPDGQVIMTDELVRLSKNDDEIRGVLLHEIGHVENRHGMRMIIQNAGVFILISALVGDVTSITSAAASLPTVLAQSGYSRDFEREADRFAAAEMDKLGLGTGPLRDILARMSEDIPELPGEEVYSSHPVMQERLEYLEELDVQVGEGKKTE